MRKGVIILTISILLTIFGTLEVLVNVNWELFSISTLILLIGIYLLIIGVKIIVRHIKYEP